MRRLLLAISMLLLAATAGRADTTDVTPPPAVDTARATDTIPQAAPYYHDTVAVDTATAPAEKKDTIQFMPPYIEQGKVEVTDTTNYEKHLTQNPTVALFKSMLVPGLGQIGNHSYVKAGVFIVLETWFIGEAIHYGSQASDFKTKFENATDIYARDNYYQLYQDRRSARNKYTWFAGITIFVSMFDAYVDAQLSGAPDQPHEKKFDLDVRPDNKGGANLSLSMRF